MIYLKEVSNNTKNDIIKTTTEVHSSASSLTLIKSWNVFINTFLYKALNTDE